MATLEERAEKKRQELKALDAKIADKKKKEREQERKWRERALIILGGDVLAALALDWKEIDPAKFEQQLRRIAPVEYADGKPVFDCKTELADARTARKRYTDHQAEMRDRWKQDK